MVRDERRRALGSMLATLVTVAWSLVLTWGAFTPVGAEPQSPAPQAWILVDVDSGVVLDGANYHVPLRPASTTKIMTAVAAVERLDPQAPVSVSANAAAQPASKMGIAAGEQWPLDVALAGMLMASSNDLAYALAEAVGGGDLAAWEEIVNDTADRLGMQDSNFNDPAGLDAAGEAYSSGPMVSAYDIAIATRNAISVPALAAIGSARSYEFEWPGTDAPATIVNHNQFVEGGDRAYSGATGFKTGYTDAAGHTLVATAERDDRELIAVVLDTYDMYGWAAQFLDAGFATDPAAGGTGDELPDVEIQPYASRQADLDAFVSLALGPTADLAGEAADLLDDSAGPATAPDDTTTASSTSTPSTSTTAAPSTAAATDEPDDAEDAARSAVEGAATRSSGISTTWLVVTVIAVIAVAFVARRRQITLRKRRRAARRRVTRQAMRRGTLNVADGRPPVARRASSPRRDEASDSHVKVVPMIKPGRSRATTAPSARTGPSPARRPPGPKRRDR